MPQFNVAQVALGNPCQVSQLVGAVAFAGPEVTDIYIYNVDFYLYIDYNGRKRGCKAGRKEWCGYGVILLILATAIAAGAYRLAEKARPSGEGGRAWRFLALWIGFLLLAFAAGEALGLLPD